MALHVLLTDSYWPEIVAAHFYHPKSKSLKVNAENSIEIMFYPDNQSFRRCGERAANAQIQYKYYLHFKCVIFLQVFDYHH